jgi:putative DNA primase/helicase
MSFINFARAHGIEIDPNRLFASDKIRRCGTVDKPRSTNGAYFWDGKRGWVFNWSSEARVQWYDDPDAAPWTEQEKREAAAARARSTDHQIRRNEAAAMTAKQLLENSELQYHPYLEIKGFKEELGHVYGDKLLIPMFNVTTGILQGCQRIWWDEPERKYQKKMLDGMRAKHAVFWLGSKRASEVFLVEGYATGLSLRFALRQTGSDASVLVCFSAANLVQVSSMISGTRYVFADHDVSGVGEQAAKDTGLPYCMSPTRGFDANDEHQKNGLFALARIIVDLRRQTNL